MYYTCTHTAHIKHRDVSTRAYKNTHTLRHSVCRIFWTVFHTCSTTHISSSFNSHSCRILWILYYIAVVVIWIRVLSWYELTHTHTHAEKMAPRNRKTNHILTYVSLGCRRQRPQRLERVARASVKNARPMAKNCTNAQSWAVIYCNISSMRWSRQTTHGPNCGGDRRCRPTMTTITGGTNAHTNTHSYTGGFSECPFLWLPEADDAATGVQLLWRNCCCCYCCCWCVSRVHLNSTLCGKLSSFCNCVHCFSCACVCVPV